MNNLDSISNLDDFRVVKGDNELINNFSRLVVEDKNNAISLVNDNDLKFITLFLLKEKIYENNLVDLLNERNRAAIDIMNDVKNNTYRGDITADISSLDYVQVVYHALKWILVSGIDEYCLNCEYNEVVDMSAIFLIKVYNDLSVLPVISDLLFKRKNRGYYTHELVWAFFEARNVDSLEYIARGLLSNEKSSVNLACKLLNFIPNIKEQKNPYEYTVKWIEDNRKFIFFTGETQQQRIDPIRCEVCVIAKYLNKRIDTNTGELIDMLTEKEKRWLIDFDNGDYEQMTLLADYSKYLYSKGLVWWEIWHSYPIDKQVKIAKAGGQL